MFNISKNTKIINYDGQIGTLYSIIHDVNMRKNIKCSYVDAGVMFGTVDILLGKEWKTLRFECENQWAKRIEIL